MEGRVIRQVNIETRVSGLHVIKHRPTGVMDGESLWEFKGRRAAPWAKLVREVFLSK